MAPVDQAVGVPWSNVLTGLVSTSELVGAGQANTNAIIAQAGHVTSAAKIADDYNYWNYLRWLTQEEFDAIVSKRTILEY